MAIQLQTTSRGELSANSTSVSAPVPSGTVAGDVLVAELSAQSGTAAPDQTGWVTLAGSALGTISANLYLRVATGTEGATVTFTGLPSGGHSLQVARWSGVDTANAIDAPGVGFNQGTTTNFIDAPSLTITTPGAVAIYGLGIQSGGSTRFFTPPSGVTLVAEDDPANGFSRRGFIFQEPRAAAGATGTRRFAMSASLPQAGAAFALRPAADGGTPGVTAPTVNAGADASGPSGTQFTRTATETGADITSRKWEIVSGPDGTGTTISTTASLAWIPPVAGTYVLRYTATNAGGSGTDDVTYTASAPAGSGALTRVQSNGASTYLTTATATSLPVTLTSPATAGNLLIAGWGVDKAAGTLTPPADWTALANRSGTSISLLVAYKVAAGGETGATASWTTGSFGASAGIAEYSGIDPANLIGPSDFPAYDNLDQTATITLNPTAATQDSAALVFIAQDSTDTVDVSGFQPASPGFTLVRSVSSASVDAPGLALLEDLTVPSGTDLNATFNWTIGDQKQGYIVLIGADGEPTGPTAPIPVLAHAQNGDATPTSVKVAVETVDATAVRMQVATNDTFTTGVVTGDPVPVIVRNGVGWAHPQVTGLPENTAYHYRFGLTDADGVVQWTAKEGTTRTGSTSRMNHRVVVGACFRDNASQATVAMATRGADIFAQNGDWWYHDGKSQTVESFRDSARIKARTADTQALLHSVPIFDYSPDDHDGHTDDGVWSQSPTGWQAWNDMYREMYALQAPIPATRGMYHARTWKGVRYITLDTRSFATPGTTVLGADQKAWFYNELDTCVEDLIVIFQGSVWIGALDSGGDGWLGTIAERNEVATRIRDCGTPAVITAGDMHGLAFDDGRNSPGNVPVMHCGPLHNGSSQKGGPYQIGPYPSSGTTTVEQYGELDVAFTDTTVAISYTGYSAPTTVRIAKQTLTYPLKSAVVPAAGTVTGSWRYAGTVAGSAARSGSVAGSWGYVGAASGTTSRNGSASGAWGFSGTIAGDTSRSGDVAGAWGYEGSATGSTTRSGTVTGTWGHDGTIAGSATHSGSVAGQWGYDDTVNGATTRDGAVTGSYGWASTISGEAPAVPGAGGNVTGSWGYSSTITGAVDKAGAVIGEWGYDTTITGAAPIVAGAGGTVTGAWGYTGTVAGATNHSGTVEDDWGYLSTVTGFTSRSGLVEGTWGYSGAVDGSNSAPVLDPLNGPTTAAFANDGAATASFTNDGSSTAEFATTGAVVAHFTNDGTATANFAGNGAGTAVFSNDGAGTGTFVSDGIGGAHFA